MAGAWTATAGVWPSTSVIVPVAFIRPSLSECTSLPSTAGAPTSWQGPDGAGAGAPDVAVEDGADVLRVATTTATNPMPAADARPSVARVATLRRRRRRTIRC